MVVIRVEYLFNLVTTLVVVELEQGKTEDHLHPVQIMVVTEGTEFK